MKKILFFVLTVLAFTSCNKDIVEPQSLHSEQGRGITIRATIGNTPTKTTVEYGNQDYTGGEISKWVAGDMIHVYFYDGTFNEGDLYFEAESTGTTSTFRQVTDGPPYVPVRDGTYSVVARYNEMAIYFSQQTQSGVGADYIGPYDPMKATLDNVTITGGVADFSLSFSHDVTMLRFSLKNNTGSQINIEGITVSSSRSANGFYSSGRYSVTHDFVPENIDVIATLMCNLDIANGNISDFYMMVPGNTVSDPTDDFLVRVFFSGGQQEFSLPRSDYPFLANPFDVGMRYYFKLAVTGSNIESATYNDVRYEFNTTTKKATVTGKTNMITSITIPEIVSHNSEDYAVVSIGNRAFANDNYLSTISIPVSVTSIGKEAFAYCISLNTAIDIPAGVISIGEFAFMSTSIATINMACPTPPALGSSVFEQLTGLTINVPGSAATDYNTVINGKQRGWTHNSVPVTLVNEGTVPLTDLGGATGDVTVSAIL